MRDAKDRAKIGTRALAKAKPAHARLSPRAGGRPTVYVGVSELLTLAGAARKDARRPSEEDLGVIKDACLVEAGGRIAFVGRRRDLPAEFSGRRAERRDLHGACVAPAFVECHTHLAFGGSRADEFERRCRGESYAQIAASGGGILSTVRATRAASLAELRAFAQARALEFASQGVATIEAKSGYGLEAKSELKTLRAYASLKGPRIVSAFLGAHAVAPEAKDARAHLAAMAALLPEIRRLGLATRVDAFVERGYFEPEIAEPYFAQAKALGFDLAVHADQLSRCGGAQLAVRMGARSAEHLVQIDQAGVDALAASETTCVLLPAADLYLDCAYPPARSLIDAGARVALATDFNPGSSPTLDLALVGVLARIKMKMTLPETIVAYTLGAAYALGLGGQTGALLAGRLCDFSVLSENWRGLFYSVGRSSVVCCAREGRRIAGRWPAR